MQKESNHKPIITVVRDPSNPLGKRFDLKPDGKVSKKAAVNLSFGIAVQHYVPTHADLAKLLAEVGNDPSAAIINASFIGIDIGEEFIILSERQIKRRLGIPKSARDKQKGVHPITYNGKSYKAVGRFKENVRPSSWQYFDRDIDTHTPENYARLPDEDWFAEILALMPGVSDVSYVRAGSTSSRVLCDGVAVGGNNGHVWVKVTDPDDIERFRTAMLIRAAEAGVTWLKPRNSRKEPGNVVGKSLTTIFDPSVFTPGRLVFIGRPVVGDGLSVEPLSVSLHKGLHDTLDTSVVILPDALKIREITRKAGVEMDVQAGNTGLRITAQDLTLDTELEIKNGEIVTVRQLLERGQSGKLRCQTPFRGSTSFAAFYSVGTDGKPFVYDAGTGITHWLTDFETDEFTPCDYVIASPGEQFPEKASVVKNLLDGYSLRGMADEIEKQAGDEIAVLGDIALKGQATVIYAAPNTGKTLLTLALLIEAISSGKIDPSRLYYINVDDTAKGLAEKLRIAEEYGFHMLAEGYKDFTAGELLNIVSSLVENDQANVVIIVLDTLKKFVDLMDKTKSSRFTKVMRRFVLKGGTVIALAHTNKNPGRDGKPVYGGTSDIIDDTDCVYILNSLSPQPVAGEKVVELNNIKRRGNVAQHVAYKYSTEPGITYGEILASVEPVDEMQLGPLKQAAQLMSDKELIGIAVSCINSGVNTKMKLADAVAVRAGISKRLAIQIIEKYTGGDPAVHRWQFSVSERGAKVFAVINATPPVAGPEKTRH